MSGTTTVTAAGGIATFTDLSLDKIGADKVLTATSGVFTAQSPVFAVTPAAELVVQQAPITQVIGDRMTPSPVVAVNDAFGNLTAAAFGVTVSAAPSTVSRTRPTATSSTT